MILNVINKDDAVSPVIGVMLLLVVTVVIAAVITGFSTGLVGDTKSTPVVMIESTNPIIGYGPYGSPALDSIDFIHKGGDEFALSDIEITIEEHGGYNIGFITRFSADEMGSLRVLGKESAGVDAIVSTGDIIRLDIIYPSNSDSGSYTEGVQCSWTLSDSRTTNILAKGDFVILEDQIS